LCSVQHVVMNTAITPEAAAAATVHQPLPPGDDERVLGFGVMGLPFVTGHYLAFRDFPASSFSPPYLSVWHRDPKGEWTFYATTPGAQSCSRYFSSATRVDPVHCEIDVSWPTPWSLSISVDGVLDWHLDIKTTPATRLMTAIGSRLPAPVWNSRAALGTLGRTVGPVLAIGKVRLAGTTPNGQRFRIAPKRVWSVADSTAVVRGEDVGAPGPLPQQACLGDFRLPQRGICVVGHGRFSADRLELSS
jgi:hypothetical protein